MNNNMLRAPLIKSALLLAGLSLLAYLTITSSDGSVWGSLQAVFLAVFRAAQLGVGLVLALFLCIIVLIGIFFGCVAMVSRESAARMFNQLRDMVSAKLQFVGSLIRKGQQRVLTGSYDSFSPELKNELQVLLDGLLDPLRVEQSAFETRLQGLRDRVAEGEHNDGLRELVERVERQEEKINGLGEAVDRIRAGLAAIEEKIEQQQKQ